jgi:hypothetical protein
MSDRMAARRNRTPRRSVTPEVGRRRPPAEALPAPGAVEAAARPWLARHGALLAVCAVIVLVALVRLRVADVPLERDEGEYAYAGQLILQGVPPYRLAYNMKFPGTYYAYAALLALFGQTPWGIHVGLLIVNAATALLLFFLGRRLIGSFAAAVGATTFSVLTLDRWIMGIFAHATHFVILPALAGLLVLLRVLETRRRAALVGAGALLGAAVLMKQHAIVFLPLGIGLALWHDLRRPMPNVRATALRCALVLAGAAIPFALLCAVLAAQGVLGHFWFWTFQYASQYVSQVPLDAVGYLFTTAWKAITKANLPIWLLAAVGLAMLWIVRWRVETRVSLVALLVASFLAVCPGFYFREHYFIQLLPVTALLVGVAIASIDALLGRATSPTAARAGAVALFVVVVGAYVANDSRYLFSMSPREVSRTTYGGNPFIEAVDIARYLREHTKPSDRIAVVGSEPEIYFYANRKSATGYIYTYPLTEPQRYAARMQEEMIREIEAAHPDYLVFVGIRTSLTLWPNADRSLIDWTDRYTRACYDLIGVADIHSMEATAMRWDAAVAGYQPRSAFVIYTFRRKSDAPCVAGR